MAYKAAIIGYGGMGSWHHEQMKNKIQEIEVVGAFDLRPEAREKIVENGLKSYSSAEELLADTGIDLVIIATPNDVHKSYSIKSLQAGKNVVCEKPVTMNAGELEEVIQVARECGKVFSVHQNRRWDKDYRIIREIVNQGIIGRPYFIESRVQGSRGAMHGWRGHKQNGGGMLLDWGVHLLDQMLQLMDEPVVSVCANLVSVFSDQVDDSIKLNLRFASGVSALLEMSTNCFINHPRWHVSGTEGTAVVEDWACNGRVVKLDTAAEMEWADDIVYTEAGPTRTMAPRPVQTTRQMDLPEVQTDWSDYYKNIAGVLAGKEELIVKPEQALRVMKLVDLLFESEKQKKGLECTI